MYFGIGWKTIDAVHSGTPALPVTAILSCLCVCVCMCVYAHMTGGYTGSVLLEVDTIALYNRMLI